MTNDERQDLARAVGLSGPEDLTTPRERRLWKRLEALHAAALRVLSDVDDDGVAERGDVAICALEAATAT